MRRAGLLASKERLGEAGALLSGLALRTFFVWKHPRFVGDTLIYGDLAHNLLAHHVYGLTEDGHVRSTLIRLPGYPGFLALCFLLFGTANYLVVVWVQVLVDLLGCWLLSRTAEQLFGRRTGRTCLWLAALCPFTANYAAAPLTETLSIFCVVTALWGLLRWGDAMQAGLVAWRWAVGIGLALCAAVLLRPDGILLAGAVLPGVAWLCWRLPQAERGRVKGEQAWSGLAIAAGCLVVCLSLWTARNWRVYHVIQPLAPKYANDPGEPAPLGFARWYRTWGTGLADTERVYWEYDGSVLNLRDLPPWAFDSPAERVETEQVYARYNADSSSTPPVEAAFDRLATERIQAHPIRCVVTMPVLRLGDMWFRPRTELMQRMPLDWWQIKPRPMASLFSWGYGLLNVALLALAVMGWLRWRRAAWNGDAVAAAVMGSFALLRCALLLSIDNSEPRYVLECYPVILLLAALALCSKRPTLDRRREPEA